MHWLLPVALVLCGQLGWALVLALIFIIQEHFDRKD